MADFDISEVDRGTLAMLAGVGFVGMILFFYFFMTGAEYEVIYNWMVILIVFASLAPLMYLFDDLNAIFNWALSKDDPDEFKKKVRRGSNFMAGMLLMGLAGINLIAYTEHGGHMALRLLVMTALALVSVFLLLYSMFMTE